MNYKRIFLIGLLAMSHTTICKNFLIIAHRGASGYAEENTQSAFEKAIELGADMIEFDIHKSASGEIVVIHDATVDRTMNGTGFIKNIKLKELKKFRTPKEQSMLTLQEAFDCINKRAKIIIEIKGRDIEDELVQVINEYVKNRNWSYDDFLVSSFDHHQLKKVKKLNPEIHIGVLVGGIPIDYAACAQKIDADSIHGWKEYITQEYVDDAHQRGLKFFAFTVNGPDEIDELIALDVDGIITDYPDLFFKTNYRKL